MNFSKVWAMVVLLAAAVACRAETLKVLTIGNSFADSAFHYLPQVVNSVPGCKIEMDRANIGGCTLERHWHEYEKAQKDSNYKPYRLRNKKRTLQEILLAKKWDVVTIQQASHESFNPESYEPYAGNLIKLIRELAPQAEIIIQQTWSWRLDDGRYQKYNIDQTQMYERLTKCYKDLAQKYQFKVIPTGDAVQLTRTGTPENEKFKIVDLAELKTLQYPTLPQWGREVVGKFYWGKNKKGERFIVSDPAHLNDRGDYLQACLWFAMLYNRKTAEIKFIPKTIEANDAQFLRQCAQTAADNFPQVKKQ